MGIRTSRRAVFANTKRRKRMPRRRKAFVIRNLDLNVPHRDNDDNDGEKDIFVETTRENILAEEEGTCSATKKRTSLFYSLKGKNKGILKLSLFQSTPSF